jgi:hypothetical protein
MRYSWNPRSALFAAGFLVLLGLQLQFVLLWNGYYSRFPWPGYSTAMKAGLVPPFLTTSPKSYFMTRITLLFPPLVALLFPKESLVRAWFSLWAGAMAATVAIWVATPRLRNDSNLWPIDLVYLGYVTGLPLFLGIIVVFLVRRAGSFLGRGRRGVSSASG